MSETETPAFTTIFCWKGFKNLDRQMLGHLLDIADNSQLAVIVSNLEELPEEWRPQQWVDAISAADFTPQPDQTYLFVIASDDANIQEEAVVRAKIVQSGAKLYQFCGVPVRPHGEVLTHFFDPVTWRWVRDFYTNDENEFVAGLRPGDE